MISTAQVRQKVDDAFALRVGEKVIIELNGEVRLCMEIWTRSGLKIANDIIDALQSKATEADYLRIITAEIGTPSAAMLQ